MVNFILRAIAAACGLWVAAKIVSGLSYSDLGSLIVAAVLLGLVNAILRPIVIILTLPFTILTLGLFLFVVNGLMLALTAYLIPGFNVDGIVPAILGSIVVSVVGWVVSLAIDRAR